MTDAVRLRAVESGVVLRLRVKPGARQDRVVGGYGEVLKVEVRAVPERGKANVAVVKLLAKITGVPRAAVRITVGTSAQDKSARIDGVTVDDVISSLDDIGVVARA